MSSNPAWIKHYAHWHPVTLLKSSKQCLIAEPYMTASFEVMTGKKQLKVPVAPYTLIKKNWSRNASKCPVVAVFADEFYLSDHTLT